MEVRSCEGSAGYVVLRLSADPFDDAETVVDEAEKQTCDMNSLVNFEKPKKTVSQVTSCGCICVWVYYICIYK